MHAITIKYILKSEVSILLCFQLFSSTRNVAVQMDNRMNPVTIWILVKHSHRETVLLHSGKLLPCVVGEKNWNRKEDKGAYCTYCSQQKGTYRTKQPNFKKILSI